MTLFKKLLFSVVLSIPASNLMACDPIAINWTALYAKNDKNHDKNLQLNEWLTLDFSSSNYDGGFESNKPLSQIFKELDANKNQQLDQEELYDIYLYLPNPCANFDMRNSQPYTPTLIERLEKIVDRLF